MKFWLLLLANFVIAISRPSDVNCIDNEESFWCSSSSDTSFYWCATPSYEGFVPCPDPLKCLPLGMKTSFPCAFLTEESSNLTTSSSEILQSSSESSDIKIGSYLCDKERCKLPNCRCCDDSIPLGSISEVPQFILFTVDDDLESRFWPLIKDSTFNSNAIDSGGCHIAPTFFINNEYTDYQTVTEASLIGSEIACHTYHHQASEGMSIEDWKKEIESGRKETATKSNISESMLLGFRAPNLFWTAKTLQALQELGYLYDASLGQRRPSEDVKNYMFPCTFDYGMPRLGGVYGSVLHESFPSLWEIPMHLFEDSQGNPLSVMDPTGNADEINQLLRRMFEIHWSTNRSPFGIWIHASWLIADERRVQVLQDFFRWITTNEQYKNNVFFATGTQLIHWMQNPIDSTSLALKGGLCSHD